MMKESVFFPDISNIKIDPNMVVNPNPAPKKMAMAIEFFEKNGLPERLSSPKKSKQNNLTVLQKELLEVYALEPSEQQMAALKAFLADLFSKTTSTQTIKANQELEMSA